MIDLNDVVRFVLTWTDGSGNIAQNVWHYICTVGGGIEFDDAAEGIAQNYDVAHANIDQNQANNYSVSEYELLQWDFVNNRWDGVYQSSIQAIEGTHTGGFQPHGTAFVGHIFTSLPRRAGRVFFPGMVEADTVDGFWVAQALTDFALFLADLDDDVAVVGGTLSWCTFNTDDESPFFETASKAIGSVEADNVVGYQRRRKPGVGL